MALLGEGSSGETARDEKGRIIEEGDSKGPSVLSTDQSAITGESLAVDKCKPLSSCVQARAHTTDT